MAVGLDYEAREPSRSQGHPHPSTPTRNLDRHAPSYLLQSRCAVVQPPIYGAANRMLDSILAVCRRRERISSRPAEFQTMPSAWQLAFSRQRSRFGTYRDSPDWLYYPMLFLVYHTACLYDGPPEHWGSDGGRTRLVSSWQLTSCSACSDQASKVWARSRSSSVVNLLGPVQSRPVLAVPPP